VNCVGLVGFGGGFDPQSNFYGRQMGDDEFEDEDITDDYYDEEESGDDDSELMQA